MARRPASAIALILTAAAASLVIGCAPIRAKSYSVPQMDVRQYRSYAWGERDRSATGDPRLDNNRFFDESIRRQVDSELTRRGFEKAESERAEVLVYYHARVAQEVDSRDRGSVPSYCRDERCEPFIYDKGTLWIDLVEHKSNTLVWRGWAEGSIEGYIDTQAWMETRVADTVAKIFARLPALPRRH